MERLKELPLQELIQSRIKDMEDGKGILFDAEAIKRKARERQTID